MPNALLDRTQGAPERSELAAHRWLVTLRWAAIAGQLAAVLGARFGLSLALPMLPILALLGAEAAYNAGLSAAMRKRPDWFGRGPLFGQLAVDLIALTLLLALSGGPENPFNFLYLVHIALACVVLPAAHAWTLAVISCVAFGSLFVASVPLHYVDAHTAAHAAHGAQGAHAAHGAHMQHNVAMEIHLKGMWIAFTVAAAFIVYFVTRIRASLETQTAALEVSRLRAERAERLAALGTLAAGAAHELATPLASIQVAARELERGAPEDLREEASVIRSEVERCRAVLSRMSTDLGQTLGEGPSDTAVDALVARAAAGFSDVSRIRIEATPAHIRTHAASLETALRAIIDNALRASPQTEAVRVSAEVGESGVNDPEFKDAALIGPWLTLTVTDRGPGLAPEHAARIGEPFFTTRAPGEGMGLGAFLARSVAEQLGGTFAVESAPGVGTTVTIRVPVDTPLPAQWSKA